MHILSKGEVLGCREGDSGGKNPLDSGIVRKVQEHRNPLKGPGFLKVLPEERSLLVGNSHRTENNGEVSFFTTNGSLSGYLGRELVVRKPGNRKDGELLPSYQRVHPIYRGYPSLNKVSRIISSGRINGGPVDVQLLFRNNLRTVIDGLPPAAKDTPQKIHRDWEPSSGSGKPYGGFVRVDSTSPLEDLNDRPVLLDFENLTTLFLTIGGDYFDNLVVSHSLDALNDHKGARNFAHRSVLSTFLGSGHTIHPLEHLQSESLSFYQFLQPVL